MVVPRSWARPTLVPIIIIINFNIIPIKMGGAHCERRGWVAPAGPVLRAMPLYVTRLVTVVAPLLGGGGGGHGC